MRSNRVVIVSALFVAGGACTVPDDPAVTLDESGLSTVFSFHGRVQVFDGTTEFLQVLNNCDLNGIHDFWGPEAPSPAAACTALGVERASTFNNPADLSTCAAYTATYQSYSCGDADSPIDNAICDVNVVRGPRAHASATPAFVVRSISYQVPGNRSTITYAAGDSNGSTWEVKNSTGVNVSVDWGKFGVSSQLKLQHDTSTKLSLQRSTTLTEALTFNSDVADHNRDVISLWVNPLVDRYDPCNSQTELLQFGIATQPWVNPAFDPTQPVMMDFTVGELLHPETVVDSFRKLFLAQLTQNDVRTRILALDPFIDPSTWTVVANPVLNVDRFRPVQGGTCPRNLSDPVTANRTITCQAKYNESLDVSDTFKRDWSVSTKLKFTGLELGGGYSTSYSRTTTSSNGNNNTAEIKLATSTPGTCITGQLAVDTMFNVYIVSSTVFPCATLQ